MLAEALRHPSSASLLAVVDGAPVGVVSLALADGVAVLFHSACCPGPARQGLGRLLVETGLARAARERHPGLCRHGQRGSVRPAASLGAVGSGRWRLVPA